MRIVVGGEQISFFERFGYVELESFFDEHRSTSLHLAVHAEIERRAAQGSAASFGALALLHGYGLTLSSEHVRKHLLSSQLATAAFHFVRKKPLRYAFDRVLTIPGAEISSTLDAISSVSPLMISVVIALTDCQEPPAEQPVPYEYCSFPQKQGSVAFLSPKTVVRTASASAGTYLLLAYTSACPIYQFQPADPHTHFLKGYGYVFGDQLKETTHPMVFR